MAMDLINIFEHKIYTFHLHILLPSHCTSHLIIQFTVAQPSEQWPKLSVLFFGSRPPKVSVSMATNLDRAN